MALDQQPYLSALEPLRLPETWRLTVVERPRRKTIAFTIEPGGDVTIAVPAGTSPGEVADALRRRRAPISRAVDNAVRYAPAHAVKEFVDGQHFPLLDRTYRLRLTDDGAPARIESLPHALGVNEWLCVRRGEPRRMFRAIVALYSERGLAWIRTRGAGYDQSATIAPGLTYAVRSLGRKRWGIYESRHHRVTLNWAVFGLPCDLIEYVLLHELAHASRPPGSPHGAAFKARLGLWMPDWRRRKEVLADVGRHAWLGDYRA